jgi:hypothetical protein
MTNPPMLYYNRDIVNSAMSKELDMPASDLQTVEDWRAGPLPIFEHSAGEGDGEDKEKPV